MEPTAQARGIRLTGLLLLLIMMAGCEPADAYTSTLIWRGNHTFQDDTVPGDLLLLAGSAAVAEGAALSGTAVVFGGELQLDGDVGGDITQLNGKLTIGPHAVVRGDVRHGGGTLQVADGAEVRGERLDSAGLALPALPEATVWERLLRSLVTAVLLAGAGTLLQRAAPGPVALVAQTATANPLVCGALGMLVAFVAPVVLVMMAFTLVLIPLALASAVVLLLLTGYGLVAIGGDLGRRLPGRQPAAPRTAVFRGTLLLMAGLALLRLVPWVGEWLALLAWLIALGAVLLTRLGIRPYAPPAAVVDPPASYARPTDLDGR